MKHPWFLNKAVLLWLMILSASAWHFLNIDFSVHDFKLSERWLPPNSTHWMGTDQNGLDIFSFLLRGAPISLWVSLSVVSIGLLVGTVVGSIAGSFGSWVDLFIIGFINTLSAFPGFLLLLALATVLQQQSITQLILVMSVTSWTSFARLVRGEVLHLKTREYVEGASALGIPGWRKYFFHVLPGLTRPLFVQASFSMAAVMLTESSLTFLGLGLPSNTPSWGAMLNQGRYFLLEAPHMSIFAGLALSLAVWSFHQLGEDLSNTFNVPKTSH